MLTRRASEGSEALPSLARRVRMSFFGARVIGKLASCPSWHKRQSGCLNSAFLNISQHFTSHLFRPWIRNSTRCQSRKGPPTFPWCQKVGAPFRSNSVVCVKQYPAGKGLHPAKTRSARVSRPRRSVDRRSPGDAPTLGDRETVGRRGRAGQETTARTSATVLATPSRFTDRWPLFPLTSFREPGTPRP